MDVPYTYAIFLLFVIVISGNRATENFQAINSPLDFSKSIQKYLESENIAKSQACVKSLNFLSKEIPTGRFWALQMFDAAGKLPPGILRGNGGDLGAFDECLAIRSTNTQETILGKYCLGILNKNKPLSNNLTSWIIYPGNNTLQTKSAVLNQLPSLKFGTCLPHTCSANDYRQFYLSLKIDMFFSEDTCQSALKQVELDEIAIGTLVLFGLVLSIIILSTLYDTYHYLNGRKQGLLSLPLVAFSVLTNGRKLIKINNNPSQISCLHGIRVITMMWIILGHRIKVSVTEVMLFNKADILDLMKNRINSYLLGASVSVDTFLLLSGLVISYTFMGAMSKKIKFNLLLYYFHRYLRLTPPYAAIVLINVSLMKHLGSGPQWPALVQNVLEQPCRDYWWSALLYVQNYVNPSAQCMGQTWYLSVDTQLFIVSPLFLILFYKWPKLRPYVLTVVIICAGLIPFFIMFFGEYRGAFGLGSTDQKDYIKNVYFPTHARAAPWLVGLGVGYMCYESKNSKSGQFLKKFRLYLFLWLFSLILMCAVVFGAYNIINGEYNKYSHSLYTGFAPLSWAVAVGCVIFLCVQGYGGPVNWMLSNHFMQVVSRLTYSMYLLHKFVLSLRMYTARRNFVLGSLEILPEFWGDFVMTLVLAIFWVLAFESPIIILERILFRRNFEKVEKSKPDIEDARNSQST